MKLSEIKTLDLYPMFKRFAFIFYFDGLCSINGSFLRNTVAKPRLHAFVIKQLKCFCRRQIEIPGRLQREP